MFLDSIQILISLGIVFGLGFSFSKYLSLAHDFHIPNHAAPAVGLSLAAVTVTISWFCGAKMIYSYILIITATLCLSILACRSNSFLSILELRKNKVKYLLTIGFGALITLHGAIVPFSSKISQGFPWDRYTYVGAAIGYSEHTLQHYEESLETLARDGSNKQLYENHLNMPLATNDMHRRPTVDLLYGVLNFNEKEKLNYLGHSYETFFRVLQYASFLYLASLLIANPYVAIICAGTFAFGFWFQYIKDFNAWGFQFWTILSTASLAVVIDSLKTPVNLSGRIVALSLFIVGACIGYPEAGFIFAGIVCGSLFVVYLLLDPYRAVAMRLIIAIVFAGIFALIIYPYNFSYLAYLATRTNAGVDMELERYVRSFFNPYLWSPEIRTAFLDNPLTINFYETVRLFPSLVFGLVGVHMLMKVKLAVTLPLSFAVSIAAAYETFKASIRCHRAVALLLGSYCLLWIMEMGAYWILGKKFPALRSISYVAPVISFLVIIAFLGSRVLIIRILGYLVLVYSILFGVMVYDAQRKIKYHHFDNDGYAFTHDGIRLDPFNNKGKLNDIHNLDYSGVDAKILNNCNAVFIDLTNYWHMAGLVLFLENNNLLYQTRLPYRDLLWGAGIRAPGKEFSNFFGNCRIYESSSDDGRINYTLEVIKR